MKQFSVSSIALVVSSTFFLSACGVNRQEATISTTDSSPKATQGELIDTIQAVSKKELVAGSQDTRIDRVIEEEAVAVADVAISPSVIRQRTEKKSMRSKVKTGLSFLPSQYAQPQYLPPPEVVDRENYRAIETNPIHVALDNPVSTFSIDVDTGSYSNVRRFINGGRLPQSNAVRVEELVNYFNYDYPQPDTSDTPFLITTEVAPSPWNVDSHLLHIGIKGYDIDRSALPNANLVFLVDVSGSMNSPRKIGLLKQSLKLITQKIRAEDKISIVVYAGASGVVLEGKSGNDKAEIMREIDRFQAGGSTNGAAGISLAYQLAQTHYIKGGINRVLLATDGDFNVGTVSFDALIDMVESRRQSGISLTTLGFGQGNYNDHLMEQLANKGNGNYAYIDTLQEARKVLVEEMSSTLHTIAKDVKIQVEFNPNIVQEYRLIGYENRALNRDDFNNDKIDAGEVGAGHSVTALYEITFAGEAGNRVDPLRYGDHGKQTQESNTTDELAFVKLRYKQPGQNVSQLMSQPVMRSTVRTEFNNASDRFKFSAAVAGFGQILSGGEFTQGLTLENVEVMGLSAKGKDSWGYRSEFVNLVRLAEALNPQG